MSDVAPLRLVEEPDPPGADPKVFARSISAPPGTPWDQARAARLEARAGAPLPLTEVSYQLRRLEAWRPGRPAKFAAFYVRAKEVGQRLRTETVIDGRQVEIVFVSRAETERQARRVLIGVVAAALGVLVALTSVAVAISARHSAEAQLADLERVAGAKAQLAKAVEHERTMASALDRAGVRSRGISDYLADLDWASSAKAPGARIEAVHWDRGVLAVEARGATPPFVAAGREVTKVDKPLRPNVWLWGAAARNGAP